MYKLKKSPRIKNIENKWNNSIEKLLYSWHWNNNLKHKEIGKKLSIPRSTITRWFREFKIPTQSCVRFTNNNLLYVGPNRPARKPKALKKIKEKIIFNEKFFKKWSQEMAYILGYFTADGCMSINQRGSHYISFSSADKELIQKTRELIGSKHKIGIFRNNNPLRKNRYTLQIGSKRMFQDLLKLNLVPNKSKIIRLPKVPKKYFNHFIRGYFDGDGCIFFKRYQKSDRKKRLYYVIYAIFTSGSEKLLKDILEFIKEHTDINRGKIIEKNKNSGFELRFSDKDSIFKLYKLMYQNVPANQFLTRKYLVFQKMLNHLGT